MYSVQKLIDEIVEKNNQVKAGGRDKNRFHVSDAGTCYRKRFYKRLGIEPIKDIETASLRKMLAGDAGHEKLQTLLRRSGKLLVSEATVENEHVVGHFDGIVKNGEKVLLEIKTVEKFSMNWIKKSGAKPEHKIQMFTYWNFLRDDYKDLDTAVLSYVKREDFEAHDYYFKWTDEIAEQVEKEWTPLLNYWRKAELPPCTCHMDYGGAGVKYCRFQEDELNCCSEDLYKNFIGQKVTA